MLSQLNDEGLKEYFTNVEQPRNAFSTLLTSPKLHKRLLIIHGVGGVGKSSLLQMFLLYCKRKNFPTGLASGDSTRSSLDVLNCWAVGFETNQVTLKNFTKTLSRYKAIQAKVENKARKSVDVHYEALDTVGKRTAKMAVEAATSALPIVGPIAGALGGVVVESLVGWLSRFLSKPEVDLVLDPVKQLTTDFLDDLARCAQKQRCVLMLDTLDRMINLEDWLRNLAQRLHPNILLVIAGRKAPKWNLQWPGWMAQAEIHRLKPMTPKVMRTLIHSYYKYIRGGEPDPTQVEAIIRFSRGLPMVVNSAVRLWVEYNVEDFQTVKAEVIGDLVDRFRIDLPKEIYPFLEAAATVRWFNKEVLSAVSDRDDLNDVYANLCHLPIVRPCAEGLALHDSIREIMDEGLKMHEPGHHQELHKRAAEHFRELQKRLNVISPINEDWQRLVLEEVFHLLQASENEGLNLLHTLFNEGLSYFRYQLCRKLVNDAESLGIRNSKLDYRLKYYGYRLTAAEFSWGYVAEEEIENLIAKSDLDLEIQWEIFLTYASYLGFAAKHEQARDYTVRSLKSLRANGMEDSVAGCVILTNLAGTYCDPSIEREELIKRALDISCNIGKPLCGYDACVALGHLYFTRRKYSRAKRMWLQALGVAKKYKNDERIADALNRIAQSLIAMGELSEAEDHLNAAMRSARRLPDTLGSFKDKEMYINRHFGVLYYTRGEYDQAIKYLSQSAETYRERRSINGLLRTLVLLAECLYEAGNRNKLETIAVEVEGLVKKTSLRDFAARWFVLHGHMFVDEHMHGCTAIKEAIGAYREAIKDALESNTNALDDTVDRVLWRLSKLPSGDDDQTVDVILRELIEFWKTYQVNGKTACAFEHEKRKLAGPTGSTSFEPQILARLENSLRQGIQGRRPECWRGL